MKYLSTILIFLLLLGCTSKSKTRNLEGIWKNCSEDGYYVEIYVQNNKYRYAVNSGKIYPWNDFKIIDNIIIQYSKNIDNEKVTENKTEITFITKDKIELKYLNSGEIWIMDRVKEKVNLNSKESVLLEGTLERAKTSGCNDSIFSTDPSIYFQF